MRNILIGFFVLFITGYDTQAQTTRSVYSLNQLMDSAINHFPVSSQRLVYDRNTQLNQENIEQTFYPTMQLNGQVSYQSEVTQLKIPIQGFTAPEMAKDWYKLNLDISQMIYDGGSRKSQREIETFNFKGQVNNVLQQEFHFKEMISKIYFRILLFDKSIGVLKSSAKSLQGTLDEMQAALKGGTILQADVNAIKAEYLGLYQKIQEAESNKMAAIDLLSVYTAVPVKANDSLLIPPVSDDFIYVNLRPELTQLKLQQEKLGKMKSLLGAKQRPIVQAYGQLGYGRPGLNMLEDDFKGYYIAGLRLNYKFWDWNTTNREKQLLGLQQQVLESEKENFDLNLRANFASQLQEIEKLKNLIETDKEIIALQETVVEASKKRLKSGTITTAAYIQEFEKYTRSQLNYQMNTIKLVNANIDYMFLTGNFNTHE
ncbi:MAG: TolC family protein [Bacteroidales bacterium]|nr:TolC family protein [Bacteroidales bacterium]